VGFTSKPSKHCKQWLKYLILLPLFCLLPSVYLCLHVYLFTLCKQVNYLLLWCLFCLLLFTPVYSLLACLLLFTLNMFTLFTPLVYPCLPLCLPLFTSLVYPCLHHLFVYLCLPMFTPVYIDLVCLPCLHCLQIRKGHKKLATV